MIERVNRRVSARRLAELARQLLDASTLCAISTVARGERAHINTAYFAWDRDLTVVWSSHPDAEHSRHIAANGSVAIAVFDSTQTWGRPDRGLQLFGTARAAAAHAEAVYAARFPAYRDTELGGYRFYAFRPRRLKLFDERALGGATFVTARVARDGSLSWERTERYRSAE